MTRLYIPESLSATVVVDLSPSQAHHVATVLRMSTGAALSVFNERDGEWSGELTVGKKGAAQVLVTDQTRSPESLTTAVHLIFAPLKNDPLTFLIEKTTELGVTDFHPVITQHTHVRQINADRLLKSAIDAAQQCERLSIPQFYPLVPLSAAIESWSRDIPLLVCRERGEAQSIITVLQDITGPVGFAIGPEGGWHTSELALMERQPFVKFVHLGKTILRAETAGIAAIAVHSCSRSIKG